MKVTKVGAMFYGNVLEEIKGTVGWLAPSSFNISRSGSDGMPSLIFMFHQDPRWCPMVLHRFMVDDGLYVSTLLSLTRVLQGRPTAFWNKSMLSAGEN